MQLAGASSRSRRTTTMAASVESFAEPDGDGLGPDEGDAISVGERRLRLIDFDDCLITIRCDANRSAEAQNGLLPHPSRPNIDHRRHHRPI